MKIKIITSIFLFFFTTSAVFSQVSGYDGIINNGGTFLFTNAGVPVVGSGILAVDDYEVDSSLFPCDEFEATEMNILLFVGNGGIFQFLFFNEDESFNSGFGINVAGITPGFYNFTIALGGAFEFPNKGFLQVRTIGAATGQVGFTPTAPEVGFNDGDFGVNLFGTPLDDVFGPGVDAYSLFRFTGNAIPDEPIVIAPDDVVCSCAEGINAVPDYAGVVAGCDGDFDFEVTVDGPVQFGQSNCNGTQYVYTYTVTDDFGGVSTDQQIFTIENEGPEIACPDDLVISCEDGDWDAIINAWTESVTATQSCGSEPIDVIDTYFGFAGICTSNGFNTVSFFATDDCGRTDVCQAQVIITDTEAPVWTKQPEELLIPCTANTEQIFNDWLSSYGGAEVADCWGDNVVIFPSAFSSGLNCANGPQAIVVTFTAIDGCGNSSTTTGTFNTKLLPNTVNVSGSIQTESAQSVAQVQVGAYNSSETVMNISSEDGAYNFDELAFEEDTDIVPSKNDDWLNGVSTFDLVLLQQHILSLQELDSPYKRIAADVNNSGTISTIDLVLLRRLILTLDTELADNTSWRFVDADFVFPDPANPFTVDFPEAYNLSGEEEEIVDFVAIKIGDLNLDSETSFNGAADDRSGLDNLVLSAKDQYLTAGETASIELKADNFTSLQGLQFTLEYDAAAIDVTSINSEVLNQFADANYATHLAEEGKITVSWSDFAKAEFDQEAIVFTINVTANAQVSLSEVMSINSSVIRSEAYQDGALSNLNLSFNGAAIVSDKMELYQNQPNPFNEVTMIGFSLPEASTATLTIFDVNGKVLKVVDGNYSAGYHNLTIPSSELSANGVMYYQLATNNETITKTMVSLK